MEAWWNALDFGRRKNAASPSGEGEEIAAGRLHDVVVADESPVIMVENGLPEEEGPEANENGAPPFNPRLFRPASTNIEVLRQLSRDGREETLRAEAEEEAMGREKIVWVFWGMEVLRTVKTRKCLRMAVQHRPLLRLQKWGQSTRWHKLTRRRSDNRILLIASTTWCPVYCEWRNQYLQLIIALSFSGYLTYNSW
ncbi:uncharacterized protein BJ212DRAFT_1305861 [Suillus subaureus]|uniref:Uncharacterized protein n=1 Tax=Suillus subaureus TaxID=48587 RepID=A0A9P7J078_9AGAM|nr:uncharacterized protein BJ212DRAFT_1305861 [Suillus subaureus]KAG1797945.1 hypothetical protein BJ212DRAFT_1305861 [Suillus subaureus]